MILWDNTPRCLTYDTMEVVDQELDLPSLTIINYYYPLLLVIVLYTLLANINHCL